MGTKYASRASDGKERSIFDRLGGGPENSNKICKFWLQGRCYKNPCRFTHGETPRAARHHYSLPEHPSSDSPYYHASKYTLVRKDDGKGSGDKKLPENLPKESLKNVLDQCSMNVDEKSLQQNVEHAVEETSKNVPNKSPEDDSQKLSEITVEKSSQCVPKKSVERLCQLWAQGNCVDGDQCHDLHSWFCGDKFNMLAMLQGHQKAVTGIVLPRASDKLYTCSSDGTVRLWDCKSGQCASVINLGSEVHSIISEGPWVFVGLLNAVKVWNIESRAEYSFNEPIGQVTALAVVNDLLFAAVKDGVIYAWRGSYETSFTLQLAAVLRGHTHGVTSLVVGPGKMLYSGSMDHTIRVWNHETFQCIMTLKEHNDVVTSLHSTDNYLLSSSLDRTVKIWAPTAEGNLEVIYVHSEDEGVLALNVMTDVNDKRLLYCACGGNSVHLYDLPSFSDRGRLFAKQEVGTIQIGPEGLFFTGDQTGLVTIWKCSAAPNVVDTR